ncbi:glucosaminidase domain-containing protein [Cysteiniphilum sp. QT6929]|uniref:glucosaminidase domain-containing protein n=1 Tax=Cysteiniphilum sp. QT6929 TaxID=2975055 RepID=UPI0024B34F54|nr:glucosaminidase domain-containing protein [Cysteiniphilum sp. QT6929]WHN66488.1 glucosaminidase domain-containing protein [Cysteiniphilum sp. QT6929]
MRTNIVSFTATTLILYLYATMAYSTPSAVSDKPNFKNISNTQEKKQTFIDYLNPFITEVALEVTKNRQFLQTLNQKISDAKPLSTTDQRLLQQLALEYKVTIDSSNYKASINELLTKVNIVPAGLVLAQAAIESGWGTSRFAEVGNNYFGQHCFTKGCGIVPKQRGKGQIFEVQRFNSPKESIAAYYKLLNTGSQFTEFRALRHKLSKSNNYFSGKPLVDTLDNYSELTGNDYQKRVLATINYNNLCQYNPKV